MTPLPRKLGALPARSDPRALMLARFAREPRALPPRTNYWPKRTAFPLRTFGNTIYGDCTRAKQAIAQMRAERIECRRTAQITDEEVVRVYREMSDRRYGGGDNGAYEIDALSDWRKPEYTFRDTHGRPLTIDAFLRINHTDQQALRSALVTAAVHGIAICISLPAAYQTVVPPADWDVPTGVPLLGDWLPGSWGDHSMWARDYDEVGIWLVHTWGLKDQRITWAAVAAYFTEAHLVIDSFDAWRTRAAAKGIDFQAVRREVNRVSSRKIA